MKNTKEILIKEAKKQIDDISTKLIKEFYPLSSLPENIDESNRIGYLIHALSLAKEILRDIK